MNGSLQLALALSSALAPGPAGVRHLPRHLLLTLRLGETPDTMPSWRAVAQQESDPAPRSDGGAIDRLPDHDNGVAPGPDCRALVVADEDLRDGPGPGAGGGGAGQPPDRAVSAQPARQRAARRGR